MAIDNIKDATHFRLGSEWKVDQRFEIELFEALHPDIFYDAFSPTRNASLQKMWDEAGEHLMGKEAFVTLVDSYLERASVNFADKTSVLGFATTYGLRHPIPEYGEVTIKLPNHVSERGLWWNRYAMRVLKKDGVKGLIDNPTHVCLALGMGQWLDAGNLIAEPRYVGDSLKYPEREDLNLYEHFGVKVETFAIYPHAKHWSFYEGLFSRILHGKHLTTKVGYQSLKEIRQLMKMNKISHLVIQGAWLLDPVLIDSSSPVYNKNFVWLREVFKNSVEIGVAKDINPILHKYALATSERRKSAYEAGKYTPKVFAAAITFEELSEALSK